MTEKNSYHLEGRVDGLQALLTLICTNYLNLETDDVLKIEGLVSRIESGEYLSEGRNDEYRDGVIEALNRFTSVMRNVSKQNEVAG